MVMVICSLQMVVVDAVAVMVVVVVATRRLIGVDCDGVGWIKERL